MDDLKKAMERFLGSYARAVREQLLDELYLKRSLMSDTPNRDRVTEDYIEAKRKEIKEERNATERG